MLPETIADPRPPLPPPQPGNPFPAPWPRPPKVRRCQWCGAPAEVFDIDGSWCSPEHQRMDRQSETTWWRRWEQ